MNQTPSFSSYILGNMPFAEFAAAMLFALLTAFSLYLFRVNKRDVLSVRTPTDWSWHFFWADNIKRIVGTIILIFLTIRISQFRIKPEYVIPCAMGIGLISDQLALLALLLKDKIVSIGKSKIDGIKPSSDSTKTE